MRRFAATPPSVCAIALAPRLATSTATIVGGLIGGFSRDSVRGGGTKEYFVSHPKVRRFMVWVCVAAYVVWQFFAVKRIDYMRGKFSRQASYYEDYDAKRGLTKEYAVGEGGALIDPAAAARNAGSGNGSGGVALPPDRTGAVACGDHISLRDNRPGSMYRW